MQNAPAKIILFGEHAVVYGQPAIAVPFGTLTATATAVPAPPGAGLTILARDLHAVLHVHSGSETLDNALTYAAQLTLARAGAAPPDLTLEVGSTIPIGSGFGSGAAISAALIRELAAALGARFDNETVNGLVYEVEKLYHGTPSGIDNTVVVYNMPVYFVRGQAPELFGVGRPLTFVIANSGVSASTKESVGDVRKLYEAQPDQIGPILEQIGALVRSARAAIQSGDLPTIGRLMDEDHELLRQLTVSSPLLDDLCAAAREAGALGAKLSGGGRGGNVIALAEPSAAYRVSSAFRAAGAAHLWTMTLEAR